MMRLLRLLFVVLACTLQSNAQSFYSRLFTTEQGLPDNYVYSVVQDHSGYVWVSTGKGLVKFDGQLFMPFTPDSLAEGDFIFTATQTPDHRLWFGSYGGKIFSGDGGKPFLFRHQINGPVNLLVASAFANQVYVVSNGYGIYQLSDKGKNVYDKTRYLQINDLLEMDADNLLLAGMEGLYRYTLSTNVLEKISQVEGNCKHMQALQLKKDHYLFHVPEQGVFAIQFVRGAASANQSMVKPLYKTTSAEISSFYLQESEGDLYLGRRDEKMEVLNIRSGLTWTLDENEFAGMTGTILPDRENNVWISTLGNGLYRLLRKEFEMIQSNGHSVFAITQDRKGLTYFGTEAGVEVHDASGTLLREINRIATVNLGKVNALHLDSAGQLWIGTNDRGLFVMDPLTLKTRTLVFSAIPNIAVNSITTNEKDDEIQVNTNLDGVYAYSQYKLVNHFSSENSLLHNNVYYSLKMKNGKVYYATHNTAFNFSNKEELFEIDVKNNGLISDFNTFAEDPQGRLMIGTNGDGIYILNDTTVRPFALNEALGTKYCNGLVTDRSGDLWIVLRYGLYRYYTKDSILKNIQVGGNNQQMFNTNAFFLNREGDLFFGTNKQVLVFRGAALRQNRPLLPRSYLVKIQLSDSVQRFNQEGLLPYGTYDIGFEFSALSLKNSEDVLFSYQLLGRDNNWSPWSKNRRVEFSTLSDGDYTFRVRAMNADGFAEQKPLEFHFCIDLPVWKKWWFWLLVAVALVLLIIGVVRIRTRALIKAKERLEVLVDEKTHELREEKERVEQNNKIIAKQNDDITSSITYAKRIQEAILPQNESTDNQVPMPLLIYYRPKDIVSGDFYWYATKDNRLLIAACDCTGHGVPGAFMSMIGTTLLNKIVFDKGTVDPESILLDMDKEITKSLKQENNELKDGMEAGLCSIDFSVPEVLFAGAKRPLWIFRNNGSGYSLLEIKGDKFPIGGYDAVVTKTYRLNKVPLQKGDMLYLFSDGVTDQFRHHDNKRLSTKRLRDFLSEQAGNSLSEQHKAITRLMEEWQGDGKQIDDMLLVGIRIE